MSSARAEERIAILGNGSDEGHPFLLVPFIGLLQVIDLRVCLTLFAGIALDFVPRINDQ